MTKIDVLRRLFLPCFTATATATISHHPTTTKKRLSTSLRDDIRTQVSDQQQQDHDDSDSSSPLVVSSYNPNAPPRSSKTMVIGTIFGHRRGHVWFAVQHDRLNTRPYLLLELSIPTQSLVQEMRFGLVRLSLECHSSPESDLGPISLRSIPIWTMFCNGRKVGFAVRKRTTEPIRLMLKSLQSTTVGAGVIPSSGFDSGGNNGAELIYMRASYECIVGGPDSESFHLINPDGCLGQELSIFLMRSR
ncbi:protein MIZU-KUSSEI 1-like [Cynara cardunculus var. scolymus]|uniref:Protein MIZU-KUSSEI 1 n=1 Tax=Cynara cardunculus var. scolymus TaxID=59895 RepID=A0A118K7F2_CYNCS|nr:protein MIZU-KUSSEI 1-like [Cynara cardunculus var. scolymus]KVI12152.1 Protein of unknown function DUF617, plant [Cynara cardunculus var. scolymus]